MTGAQEQLAAELAEIAEELEDLDAQEPLNQEDQRQRSDLLSEQYMMK